MKVLVIGSINKDIVFDVDSIVKDGQTISSINQSIYLGGKGFNQTVALSNAYQNVYFYCNINQNDEEILSKVKSFNFNDDYVQKVKEQTGSAFIQVDAKGENAIVISKNANNHIDLDNVKKIIKNFNADDLVLLQNEINDLEIIINICNKQGISVALNPSPFENVTLDIVNKTKYLIANKDEFLQLTKKTSIEEGIRFFRTMNTTTSLIITLGKEGALHNLDKTIKVDGIKTNVVDTTCAGDTFLGFYLGSQCSGRSIKDSLEIANLAASICVETKGASNSIPTMKDIQKRNG